MTTKAILLCSCITLSMTISAQNKGWRGIVPLHSTRADVERLLGTPTKPDGSIYDLGTEAIFVEYSSGPCRKEVKGGYNVQKGTVIQLSVSSSVSPPFSELQIDENKYEKGEDPELPGLLHYVNREEGIAYEVQDEKVTRSSYFPAAKDNHLSCPGAPAPGDAVGGFHPSKFDEYSEIPFEDEKARLDNLAFYLKQDQPQFKGHIVVYAGRRARAGEAKARGNRARNYLIKERGIGAERIVAVDGGHREKLEVELYALPPRIAPALHSTVDPSEVQVIGNSRLKNNRRSSRPRCN